MPYNAAITLDQVSESQSAKEATVNGLLSALSAAGLYGIQTSATSGLTFTLYGGNIYVAGVPTAIATQAVTLSDNTTNYIYATAAGVVTKTTSIPAGWPGPLAADAIALYTIVTASGLIVPATSDCWIVGNGAKGDTGATGAQGAPGTEVAEIRQRWFQPTGGSSTAVSTVGFEVPTVVGTITARTLATTSLRESIPYAAYVSGAGAGSSAQVYPARNWAFFGNGAGRGGFVFSIRFCMESTSSPATQRSFFGMLPFAAIGNVEPNTLVNCFGIGANASDANFSFIHNDGSGTATKTLISSDDSPTVNFPARGTDNVYELVISAIANTTTISWRLDNINTGAYATGTVSSDLPANTVFLSWAAWTNNGSTASAAAFGLMQVVGETRY